MNARRVSVGSLLIFVMAMMAMMAGLPASAADSKTLPFTVEVTLNGSTLPAGSYEISWISHSPEAAVTFTRGGRVMATATGKWVERGAKYARDGVVYTNNADGSHTLIEIRFAGMSRALVFGS